MSSIPTCGDAPVTGVLVMSLGEGMSITIVQSASGYCFSSWIRHDEVAMPVVSDEHFLRVFASPEECVEFFRDLLPTLQ